MATRTPVPTPAHVRRRRRARALRLKDLGIYSYAAYLSSPMWKAARARYRNSDRPQACICGEQDNIDIHHMTYERVGSEPPEDLIALCRACHRLIHILEWRGDISLDFEGFESTARAAIYAQTEIPRRDGARAEFRTLHSQERQYQKARTLTNRVRIATRTANKRAIHVDDLLEELNELSVRFEERIARPPD